MIIKIVNKTKRGEIQSARYFGTLPTAINKLTTMNDESWYFEIGDYKSYNDYLEFKSYRDVEILVDEMYLYDNKDSRIVYDVVERAAEHKIELK